MPIRRSSEEKGSRGGKKGVEQVEQAVLFGLAAWGDPGIFGPNATKEDLIAVTRQLKNHSAAARIDWHKAINEGHLWTDEQYQDFMRNFHSSCETFMRLLERKRRLESDLP